MPTGISLKERCEFSFQRVNKGVYCYESIKGNAKIPFSFEITSFFANLVEQDYKGTQGFTEVHNKNCSEYPNLLVK